MKIAIFLPNWVGDAVMATPTLRALQQHFGPRAQLLGIMRPVIAQTLANTAWLNASLHFDPHATDPQLRSRAVVRRLREELPDIALLLTNSFRTALVAWRSGARRRVGYDRYLRGWLLTQRLAPLKHAGRIVPRPMVDYYLELAYALGCAPQQPQLELALSTADQQAAEAVWRQYYLRQDRVVVLNCSGAFGAAKLWPVEHFAALAQRLASEADYDVLILCGPSERALAAQIEGQAAHPRVVSLARQPLSIGLSKACVRRARLMVSTDSGPRHFAVAFGVPVVTLFGPTHPAWVHNPTAQAIDLQVELPCLGCQQRTCPLGHHRCMQDLSVQQVFQSVQRVLGRQVISAA